MSGQITGLRTRIKQVAPNVDWYYCFLHREALAAKKMPQELKQTMGEVIKTINFIKSRALNSRLFNEFCKGMDSQHVTLLLHTEVRWLSKGNSFARFWELRDEVALFLIDHKFEFVDKLHDLNWLKQVAFLTDIFGHFKFLNLSLQGREVDLFIAQEKIEAMILKLKLWERRFRTIRTCDSFATLTLFLSNSMENLSDEDLEIFTTHLSGLQDSFRAFFHLRQI